jgi:sec-independent protein translocase protein TatA
MAGLTPAHLLLILIIALIVVGPGKLPEVGAAIGKSFREFQKATGDVTNTLTKTVTAEPPQAGPAAQQIPGAPQPPAQSYYAYQATYVPPAYPDPMQPQPGYPAPVPMQPVPYPVQTAPVAPDPAAAASTNPPADQPVG